MIGLSFFLILIGLSVFTAYVLLLTLHITGNGKWPGLSPRRWDSRLKKLLLGAGCGLFLTLAGILAGYGI